MIPAAEEEYSLSVKEVTWPRKMLFSRRPVFKCLRKSSTAAGLAPMTSKVTELRPYCGFAWRSSATSGFPAREIR